MMMMVFFTELCFGLRIKKEKNRRRYFSYLHLCKKTDNVTFHINIYVKKQTTLLFISTFMEKNRQRYFSYLHLWKKLLKIFFFFYVLTL